MIKIGKLNKESRINSRFLKLLIPCIRRSYKYLIGFAVILSPAVWSYGDLPQAGTKCFSCDKENMKQLCIYNSELYSQYCSKYQFLDSSNPPTVDDLDRYWCSRSLINKNLLLEFYQKAFELYENSDRTIFHLFEIIDDNKKDEEAFNFDGSCKKFQMQTSNSQDSSTRWLIDDRDNKTYKTVIIDSQEWMAENLNFVPLKTYNSLHSYYRCYDNQHENCKNYGGFYNWHTATLICPKGWHLPSQNEWETLISYVGGKENAGRFLKSKFWGGIDSFHFTVHPSGYHTNTDLVFEVTGKETFYHLYTFRDIGISTEFWTSTKALSNRETCYSTVHFSLTNDVSIRCLEYPLSEVHNVRCVKD